MIENYNDDKKMAEYGRYCAKNSAIRKAKETIRNLAVMIGNSESFNDVSQYKVEFDKVISDLLEALNINNVKKKQND